MSENLIPKNQLLAALPSETYQHLLPKFERIDLNFGERLYSPGEDFKHVTFIESGIIGIMVVVDNESTLQCCMAGDESMVGLPVFLGIKTSRNRAVVQCQGTALQMKVADFRKACAADSRLPAIMHQFAYHTLMQISLAAACNRFHELDARLARWLLMMQDRVKSIEFKITHEFMSYMLGVRREAVTLTAGKFQEQQLISYSRGNFSMLDRKGLEKLACSCYQPLPVWN